MPVIVAKDTCIGCGACVGVCPVGALSQKDFEAPKIDYDKCIRCGKCSNFCPKKALVLD